MRWREKEERAKWEKGRARWNTSEGNGRRREEEKEVKLRERNIRRRCLEKLTGKGKRWKRFSNERCRGGKHLEGETMYMYV